MNGWWQTLGFILQVSGLVIALAAVIFEGIDRTPKAQTAPLPETPDPWERAPVPHENRVTASERMRWLRSTSGEGPERALGGFGPGFSASRPDPDLQSFETWMKGVEAQRRAILSKDWRRQEAALRTLYEANAELFSSIRMTRVATRRRVLAEMAGLLLAITGLIMSTIAN